MHLHFEHLRFERLPLPRRLQSMRCAAIAFAVAALGVVSPVVVSPVLAQDNPLRVLATVGMVGDVAARIGGACTDVTTMIGPGSDPHLYQPRPSDVAALQDAELILYSGHGLEGQLGAILARVGQSRPVVAVAEAAVPSTVLLTDPAYNAPDPHLWMDAALWSAIARPIADAVAALRPACKAELDANVAAFTAEALALHEWAKASIASIPQDARRLVTAHDAFAYLARAYGIPVTAIQGISTETEAAIADIEAVAALVLDNAVPAVFIESTVNPRTMQAVIDAVAAKGGRVAIGGELLSDALGPEGSPAGTWLGMLHANIRTITLALGGTPPPLPEALSARAAQSATSP